MTFLIWKLEVVYLITELILNLRKMETFFAKAEMKNLLCKTNVKLNNKIWKESFRHRLMRNREKKMKRKWEWNKKKLGMNKGLKNKCISSPLLKECSPSPCKCQVMLLPLLMELEVVIWTKRQILRHTTKICSHCQITT